MARHGARAVGALAVLAVLVCACVLATGGVAGGAPVSSGASGASPSLDTVVIPDLGPGYTVTAQGPLNAAQFATDAPNPATAASALSSLGSTISTYERVWQADGGLNQVQDLVVRFPNTVGAQVFLQAAQHSLQSGEIVGSDSVPSIPGARRVTYFGATNQDGVGEAITMRSGVYVALLSFFSASTGNAQPISPANAEQVAKAQHAAMASAPGGDDGSGSAKKGVSGGTIVLAVVVVAVLSLAVAAPVLLRRRRPAVVPGPPLPRAVSGTVGGTPAGAGAPSGGDAVHDLSEHRR
jgi:hypothetical protein